MHYPIIYVRGYAATTGEQDDTTADPFCGFNLGSTVYRAMPDRKSPPKKFIFESPVVRLASDHGYSDVYYDGHDIMDSEWAGQGNTDPAQATLTKKSIIIYRYYDEASSLLGTGNTPDITHFAKGLSNLILRLRDLVCRDPNNGLTKANFKCYLIAHSMGGLIVRAFLQNSSLGKEDARKAVAKIFTYATPHNGIEVAGINVPEFASALHLNTFNRGNISKYLNLGSLYKKTGRVDWIPEDVFPSKNVFCMIGTNRMDYETAFGMARTFVGHGSDGLVRIENASICGVDANGNPTQPAARAFCYRSHSGYFGIVNSEESYQNLSRFLFGSHRADIWFDIDNVSLPLPLQAKRNVDASYQFEILASPKGKRWFLTRRVAEEDSVAVRSHQEIADDPTKKKVYLSTVFLDETARVNATVPTLTFSVTFRVRVPDYVVDNKFWFNQHFEGGHLFSDTLIIEVDPPDLTKSANWTIRCRHIQDAAGTSTIPFTVSKVDGEMAIEIPIGDSTKQPGINGKLRILCSAWNK